MNDTIIVVDLETVPDTQAARRMLGMYDAPEDEMRKAMGDGFQKLPLHQIVCIGALVVRLENKIWRPTALGAPNTSKRTEAEIIAAFAKKVGEGRPSLVSFNGHSFDLPVLRYRAMINSVAAPGLNARSYFHRYTDDALDLCDCLSSYDSRGKMRLHDLCQCLSLSGKPNGLNGSKVEDMVIDGRIDEVSAYCEVDVVYTYAVWLRYAYFLGRLTEFGHTASESALNDFLRAQAERKPHLASSVVTLH